MAEGHRQRMRNRFYKEGIDNFEPHEVLEMLLYFSIPQKDTNELAHRLIMRFGSFHGVLESSYEDLRDFGLGEKTTALLKMLPAFFNYYMKSRVSDSHPLLTSTDIGNFAAGKIGVRENEVFGVICLDIQRKYINFELINEGTVNSTSVPARKVAECALRNKASRVVFVHNHPGGSLAASNEDITLTRTLTNVLNAVDVGVIDHIIVANGRFSSMSDQGLLK